MRVTSNLSVQLVDPQTRSAVLSPGYEVYGNASFRPSRPFSECGERGIPGLLRIGEGGVILVHKRVLVCGDVVPSDDMPRTIRLALNLKQRILNGGQV